MAWVESAATSKLLALPSVDFRISLIKGEMPIVAKFGGGGDANPRGNPILKVGKANSLRGGNQS